ncbi:unnamed protein product [Caretta caretta]
MNEAALPYKPEIARVLLTQLAEVYMLVLGNPRGVAHRLHIPAFCCYVCTDFRVIYGLSDAVVSLTEIAISPNNHTIHIYQKSENRGKKVHKLAKHIGRVTGKRVTDFTYNSYLFNLIG